MKENLESQRCVCSQLQSSFNSHQTKSHSGDFHSVQLNPSGFVICYPFSCERLVPFQMKGLKSLITFKINLFERKNISHSFYSINSLSKVATLKAGCISEKAHSSLKVAKTFDDVSVKMTTVKLYLSQCLGLQGFVIPEAAVARGP